MYNLPKWSVEFTQFLSVTPQFSFSGNILDIYPLDIDGNLTTLRLKDYIRTILVKEGYDIILTLDPFVGFSHLHGDPDTIHAVLGDVLSVEKTGPPSLERTIEIMQKSVENRTAYSAIILNQVIQHDERYYNSVKFLYQMFNASQNAEPRLLAGSSYPRFNVIIWIHDQDNSLPSWYVRDNTKIRQIFVPKPDLEARKALLESLTKNVPQFESLGDAEQKTSLSLLVKKTKNLQANEIISLISLVRREIISVSDLPEAVTQYSSGLADNFWKSIDRSLIEGAEDFLSKQVFGQKHAIKRVCYLLMQSYLDLAKSQYPQNLSQPRGFFLLAGYEGVGKSTLAWALKDLLLGSDQDMITVNLSDYYDEDAPRRFLCCHEMNNGNFLAKIRKNPYSIVLFENIESAHSSVLHLISAIIRDGELLSEDGQLIRFSGCLLICTIRLQGCCPDATIHNQDNEEPIKECQTREQTAGEIIAQFFEEKKSFDFSQLIRGNMIMLRSIHRSAAKLILESMLNRIFERISAKYHVNIMISPSVRDRIEEFCCQDLARGGVSIGQRVETMVIAPLSKILIEETFVPDEKVIITHISDSESGWEVNLSRV